MKQKRATRTRTRTNTKPRSSRKMYPSSTKKLTSCIKENKSIIVENFIEMLNTIKLYHWNTHSFSQHKATDELHQRMSEHVDKFVEILLGKKEDRIQSLHSKIPLVSTKHKRAFRDQIYQYREYLINMDKCFDQKRDTDLLNIRDEILGDINQFLYLLTLQ